MRDDILAVRRRRKTHVVDAQRSAGYGNPCNQQAGIIELRYCLAYSSIDASVKPFRVDIHGSLFREGRILSDRKASGKEIRK